jgi:hypothetical protein
MLRGGIVINAPQDIVVTVNKQLEDHSSVTVMKRNIIYITEVNIVIIDVVQIVQIVHVIKSRHCE